MFCYHTIISTKERSPYNGKSQRKNEIYLRKKPAGKK